MEEKLKKNELFHEENSQPYPTNLIQGFIVERENMKNDFQKQLEQVNAKHEQEIQELRKLHEDQTRIWKKETEKNYEIMVTVFKEKIKSFRNQMNQNQEST